MHFMDQDEANLASSSEAAPARRDATPPGPTNSDNAPSVTETVDHAPESESIYLPQGRDYTSAVYGSVLAATVVVSSGDLRSPAALSTLLLVSGVVFWIAHVYAATVAGRHGGWHLGSIRTSMKHEWPVAFAAVPPAVAAAVCGLVPNISVTDGVWAALVVAIGEQQLWGYAAVRNAKLKGTALTVTILLNVVMGFIIVGLKFGVGH
jgi:hypothetical protein